MAPRLAIAFLALAACSGGSSDPGAAPCIGKCDGSGALALGVCKLVGGADGHTVHCTYHAPAADFPLRVARVTVAATRQGGDPGDLSNTFGSHVFTDSGSGDVLSLKTAQLPVLVTVIAELTADGSALRSEGEEDLSQLSQSFTLRADGDGGNLSLPFTAWAVTLDASVVFQPKADAYTLDVSPWQTFFDKTIIQHAPALPTLLPGDHDVRAVLVVPAALPKVTGRYDGGSFAIAGPGHYAVSASGFQRASSSPATPDAGPPPVVVPDAPPVVPDAPPATCGNDGQPACAGGACNPGFVYHDWDGACHACGKDGQPACAGNACDAGFVYHDWDSQCHACGQDAQPACAGNTCDAGFVYHDWDSQCHACGEDGQPACAGNACDPGFTYGSWDGNCHAS
jgi:hypothetical protein